MAELKPFRCETCRFWNGSRCVLSATKHQGEPYGCVADYEPIYPECVECEKRAFCVDYDLIGRCFKR